MADKVRLIDANDYRKRRCRTCINRVQCDNGGNLCFDIMVLNTCPTIEVEPVNGWISVKDRLPEYDKTVLVVNEDGYMHTAVRIKGSIAMIDEWQIKFGVYFMENDVWEEDEQGKITHWRNLPEPPKGE